jgi:hypothetical protein
MENNGVPSATSSPVAVTRYLPSEFVDSFFGDGALRLSSFKRFRMHSDEVRGDANEGRINVNITMPNAQSVICATSDAEAYVMSTCEVDNQAMRERCGGDGFRINHLQAFGEAIARRIPGIRGWRHRRCQYQATDVIERTTSEPFQPPPEVAGPDYKQYLHEFVRRHAADALFTKRAIYEYQAEHRFIWFASGVEQEHRDVKCPEAVQFCQRL